jgi:cell wall-associated protease
MKNRGNRLVMTLIMTFLMISAYALPNQLSIADSTNNPPNDWFLKDPQTDQVQGLSVEKTYSTLLKGKPSKTVIVAVIDSGIDIDHEDLKDVIWTNEDEIPNNGIDDDKNGYVDDIHGWNFIGGKNGNVNEDTYEVTREYLRLKDIYGSMDENKVPKKKKEEFAYWKKVKARYEEASQKANSQYTMYSSLYDNFRFANDTLKQILGVDSLTYDQVENLKSENQNVLLAKSMISMVYQNAGKDVKVEDVLEELKEAVHYFEVQAKYGYNTEFNSRTIVGDDPKNIYQKGYGNNDVEGPDPDHGTHVAGIIGANRKNEIGIKGIADNVKIMSVRAVPNGDERDKDVANAIIYAVDNGAKVINMSFGKSFSPNKEVVDKAVKYAESKGVLLIHAAGNDGDNSDVDRNFPNKSLTNGKEAANWLEIGASSWGSDKTFVASFSNYGKKNVDLFSPGVEIYSTIPNNKYKANSGTSMASPATTGIAALLLSYFPDLTAQEVKDILKQSTRKFDGLKVTQPGGKDEVEFSNLSNTGGLVNAYEAVNLAMSKKKKVE